MNRSNILSIEVEHKPMYGLGRFMNWINRHTYGEYFFAVWTGERPERDLVATGYAKSEADAQAKAEKIISRYFRNPPKQPKTLEVEL